MTLSRFLRSSKSSPSDTFRLRNCGGHHFIHAEEAVEDAAGGFGRNANPSIGDRADRLMIVDFQAYHDLAAFRRVLHRDRWAIRTKRASAMWCWPSAILWVSARQ